jgi:acetyltransferase-like isoleucine patch superfamily enzyme
LHPTAKFGSNVIIGIGVVIGENVVVGNDVFIGHNTHIRHGSVIGDGTTIRTGCLVDPNCKIGKFVKIMPHAIVGGGTVLEDFVYYGPQVMTANTNRVGYHREVDADYDPPTVKRGAVLGTACVVKPGVVIGENSVIGQLSNVTRDVPDNEVWVGNPAKRVKSVEEQDRVIYGEAQVCNSIDEYHQDLNKPIYPYSIKDMPELNE